MRNMLADRERLSVDGREARREAAAAQFHINKQIKAEFLDIDKHVAWITGMVVDRVICRRTEDGWQLIVKAYKARRRYVAYVNAATYAEAHELGGEFAARGCLTWQDDKKPPWQRKQREP